MAGDPCGIREMEDGVQAVSAVVRRRAVAANRRGTRRMWGREVGHRLPRIDRQAYPTSPQPPPFGAPHPFIDVPSGDPSALGRCYPLSSVRWNKTGPQIIPIAPLFVAGSCPPTRGIGSGDHRNMTRVDRRGAGLHRPPAQGAASAFATDIFALSGRTSFTSRESGARMIPHGRRDGWLTAAVVALLGAGRYAGRGGAPSPSCAISAGRRHPRQGCDDPTAEDIHRLSAWATRARRGEPRGDDGCSRGRSGLPARHHRCRDVHRPQPTQSATSSPVSVVRCPARRFDR